MPIARQCRYIRMHEEEEETHLTQWDDDRLSYAGKILCLSIAATLAVLIHACNGKCIHTYTYRIYLIRELPVGLSAMSYNFKASHFLMVRIFFQRFFLSFLECCQSREGKCIAFPAEIKKSASFPRDTVFWHVVQ